MMPEFRYLTFRKEGPAAIVSLNNQPSLNALNAHMIGELEEIFTRLNHDMKAGVVILRGEGKAFAAGADIKQMERMTSDEAKEYSRLGNSVFSAIERFPLPVIAAVHGYALGGGLELMMSCDLAYAEAGAKLGLPELTLGLIPGFGGAMRLARRIGLPRAKELIYTGRLIGAEEAHVLGLVNRVTEHGALMDTVMELAGEICRVSPGALKSAKPLLNACEDGNTDRIIERGIDSFSSAFDHPDARTGMSAFIAKKTPVWEIEN